MKCSHIKGAVRRRLLYTLLLMSRNIISRIIQLKQHETMCCCTEKVHFRMQYSIISVHGIYFAIIYQNLSYRAVKYPRVIN